MKNYLDPKNVPKVRKDLIDYDYIDQLSPKEKEWLNKFTNEYVGASLSRDKKTGRIDQKHLHKTNKLAKSVFDSNNQRNNDLYGVTKAIGLQESLEPTTNIRINNPDLYEQALIKELDDKAIQSVIDEYTPKPKK